MQKIGMKILTATCLVAILLCLCVVSLPLTQDADAASGSYYSGITATSGTQLLGQLHDLMATTHKKYTTYSDCSTASIVKKTDPGSSSSYVMEFYSQADIGGSWGSGALGTWNREHVWCQSLSNNLWGTTGGGSDLHHIRPVETRLNSTRGNNKYGTVSSRDSHKVYYKDANGNQIAHGGYNANGTFEPLDSVKGDVARIIFYVYTHYNTYSNVNGTTNGSGCSTYGTLNFTHVMSLSNETAAINLLLDWNASDPVDDQERTRNEEVYAIQGNRNPFIDNEQYAPAIWGGETVDTKTLTGISVTGTPSVTQYTEGASFDPTGLTVTATYDDGTSKAISAVACTWLDGVTKGSTLSMGTTSVICRYNGKEATVNGITVLAAPKLEPVDMSNLNENTPYKLAVHQGNSNKTLYAVNEYANTYYMKSTETQAEAHDVYVEKSGNGFYLLFNDNGAKTYINCITSGTYINVSLSNSANTVWTYNSANEAIQTNVSVNGTATDVFLGTYGTYTTFSIRKTSSIASEFKAYLVGIKDDDNPATSSIRLGKQATTLTVGQSEHLTAITAGEGTVEWSSANEEVVTVENGLITGIAEGTATVTATFGEASATCIVTVTNEIIISETKVTLKPEETYQLDYEATADVSWVTSNSDVATVTNGTITAVGEGSATITAICGNATATVLVVVSNSDVTETKTVTITKSSFGSASGAYAFYTWTAGDLGGLAYIYAGNANNQLQFNLGKPSHYIASNVSAGSIQSITVVGSGTAREWQLFTSNTPYGEVADYPTTGTDWGAKEIPGDGTEVTWELDGKDSYFTLNYNHITGVNSAAAYLVSITIVYGDTPVIPPQPDDSVEIDKTALTFTDVDQTEVITAVASGTPVFTSSNTAVATVSQDGTVTSVGAGTAIITVTCGLASKECSVTVTVPVHVPDKVIIDKAEITLTAEGQTKQITVTESTGDYSFTSSNPEVATVSEDGTVTAVANGTTTITVECGTASATCEVTVDIPVPDKVVIDKTEITLSSIGETDKINVIESTKEFTFSSSNTEVATVSDDGTVTAVAEGTAIIFVTCGSDTATCSVTVDIPVPDSVSIDKTSITLTAIGQTDKITVTAHSKTPVFTSLNTTVATVSQDGTVTAVAEGTAIIFVKCGTATATCSVTVTLPVPDSVSIDKETVTLTSVGQTAKISVTESTGDYTFTSSNPEVATVSDDGTVTAVANGTTTITVECGTASATCEVTVDIPVPDSVTIDKTEITLTEAGQTAKINVTESTGEYTFVSSNIEVATVSEDGTVTAVANGTTTVTVNCGNASATCEVTVDIPDRVAIDKTEITLTEVGQTDKITVEDSTGDCAFTSSNPEVATVSADGTVTAIANGTTTVTVNCGNASVTCEVTVSIPVPDPEDSVSIDKETITLTELGQTEKINVTESTSDDYNFTSSNPEVATVSEDGTVTAVANGTTNIIVKCGTASAICAVTVDIPVPDSVTIDKTEITLTAEGQTIQITVTESTGDYSFTSSNPEVATVSEDGTVTAVANGTTTITVECGTASATCEVTVDIPVPDSVTIDKTEITLTEAGQTSKINVTESTEEYTFTSSNLEVATVSQDGTVTAVANGTTTVTVNCGTAYAYCEVTVNIPDKVSIDKTEITLTAVGQTDKITVTESTGNPLFLSLDENIATVSQDGTVTAVANGTAIIAISCNSAYVTCTVTVAIPVPDSIAIDKTEITLTAIGQTDKITVTESSGDYTFTSSDIEIATVSEDGTVTAISEGTATIYVTCRSAYVTCTVTVVIPVPDSIAIDKTEITLTAVGQTAKISVTESTGEYTFASSDNAVVTVSKDGTVTAVADGTATVTVTCGTASATCEVTVAIPVPDSITIDKTEITLTAVGQTAKITVTESSGDYTFTSSDTEVATVSKDGIVTAVAEGTATIKVTCGTASRNCIVTVTVNGEIVPPTGKTEEAKAFENAVSAIENTTTREEKFNAIKQALTIYDSLLSAEKETVAESYSVLTTAVSEYNEDITKINEESSRALEYALSATAIFSLAVAALLFILKNKLL